jgi:hypothetical protein
MYRGPYKECALLQEISERPGQQGKVPHEFTIIAGKPHETAQLLDILRWRPGQNGINFPRVSSDTGSTDDMSEIGNRGLGKAALAELDLPVIIRQQLEDLAQML